MKTEIKQKYWLDPSSECRNCGYVMPEGANYCPSCSQRNTTGKINVFEFLKEALSNLFNIDTKFFRTLFSFAFPGKLTNEFFKGKHQSFASPIRMFFVIMLLFIAALSWSLQDHVEGKDFMGIEDDKEKLAIRDNIAVLKSQMDTMELNELERNGIDSFYNILMENYQVNLNRNVQIIADIRWKKIDVLKMTPDELLEKYEIENFFLRAAIKQSLKLNENPKALVAAIFGNLTLMFLILIPCIAFVFKLLYIRKKRFYVEHLVFLFHYHSFILIIGIIMLLTMEYTSVQVNVLLLFIAMIYLLVSMKKVYGQGWLKTIFKSFIIFICYVITFAICLAFTSAISFLLF